MFSGLATVFLHSLQLRMPAGFVPKTRLQTVLDQS